MGQFSWITQDTKEAIRESYGCPSGHQTSAVMHDNQGNSWVETEYEGYGVFGGKDFYELLAEMNGIEADGSADEKRGAGIELAFSDKPYISPNLTKGKEWKWVNRPPENDPNQGWGECEDED